MRIQSSHHIDSGERQPDGSDDFFYEYDLLVFGDGEQTLVARSYSDTPSEVHFLRIEVRSRARALRQSDFRDALTAEAIRHLRTLGKTEINWLGGGRYVPVPNSGDR